jgi:hypothetical protein
MTKSYATPAIRRACKPNLWTLPIEPQFNAAGDFNEGLALVAVGPRFGFIREDGKFEINPQFDKVGTFQGGLAPVWLAGRKGYINKQGKYVWNPSA